MSRIRQSLSLKLSIGFLLMAIPVFVVSLGVLFVQSRHIVRKEAMERATTVLNTSLQRVSSYLQTIETSTNANDWLILENLHPDSLLAITHRIVRLNPHVDGCSISAEPNVFPQYGRYFSVYSIREADSVTSVIEEQYEYFEKLWYKKPKELGKASWVNYYDETDTLKLTLNGMITTYSKPLYNKDNQLVAIISTDISLSRMETIINAEHPYPNSYFIMLGEEGRYLIHPDSTIRFVKTIFSDIDPRRHTDIVALGHEMTKGQQGSMAVNIDGVPCLVCYRPIPGTSSSLALICPDSDILQGYNQLAYIIIPLLFVGMIMILLLCQRTVAHTTKPIDQLLSKVQSMAEKDYEVHFPRSNREDAIGRLQNTFATMLQSLNFHMGIIRYAADQAKRRNEEMTKAMQLVEEASRQKTIFIQNVTHQIRTPLNIIMGFAQVLRDTTEQLPDEEMKTITKTMKYNAYFLNRMVQMLYDSSETGRSEEQNSHDFEEVSCNEVVRECITYTNMHFPDLHVRFETSVHDTLRIRTNKLYLMRSLREFLYNSSKYSDGKNICARVSETDTTVCFVFEDTGPGISEQYQEQMFTPFSKVDDLSEGLGLGLPLTKHHIERLGGTLTLDTDYHDGCRFIIEMPK